MSVMHLLKIYMYLCTMFTWIYMCICEYANSFMSLFYIMILFMNINSLREWRSCLFLAIEGRLAWDSVFDFRKVHLGSSRVYWSHWQKATVMWSLLPYFLTMRMPSLICTWNMSLRSCHLWGQLESQSAPLGFGSWFWIYPVLQGNGFPLMKCIPASRGGVLDQQQASSSLLSLYWAEFKISFPCWKQSHTVAAQANLTCENPGLNKYWIMDILWKIILHFVNLMVELILHFVNFMIKSL